VRPTYDVRDLGGPIPVVLRPRRGAELVRGVVVAIGYSHAVVLCQASEALHAGPGGMLMVTSAPENQRRQIVGLAVKAELLALVVDSGLTQAVLAIDDLRGVAMPQLARLIDGAMGA